MTIAQQIITIGVLVLDAMLTRFLPFLLFPAGNPIHYSGNHSASVEKTNAPVYCRRNHLLHAACTACILSIKIQAFANGFHFIKNALPIDNLVSSRSVGNHGNGETNLLFYELNILPAILR